jgi:hypothetical protein
MFAARFQLRNWIRLIRFSCSMKWAHPIMRQAKQLVHQVIRIVDSKQ